MDRDCVAGIHRAHAVAMALPSPRSPTGWKKTERREKREERREKRANGRQLDSLHFYMVREGRDGAEKGRALGERTEERKEKREGEDNHN